MTSLILVLISTVLAADEAGTVLRPEAVESLFVEPDRPATIRWRADRDLPADSLAYTLRDFQDREVGAGTAQRLDPRTVAVQLTLARGYYELELSGVATRFGLVALPPSDRPAGPFFCIDSTMSWLVRDADCSEDSSASCGAAGWPCRERLSWGEIQPVPRTIRLERPQQRNRPPAACGTASPRAGNVSFGDAVEQHQWQVPRGPPRHGGRVAGNHAAVAQYLGRLGSLERAGYLFRGPVAGGPVRRFGQDAGLGRGS